MNIKMAVLLAASFLLIAIAAPAAQDRFTLKSPNGIPFREFKGYGTWQNVAVSETDEGIKAILGNSVTINAYKEGIPGNGKPFPDGSMWVKIQWSKKSNPESPYAVTVPDTLKSVAFIEKDSKRFPDTSGYGYAELLYDKSSGTFSAFGKDSSFGKTTCYQCHTRAVAKDYIFTAYPLR
jgi:hypothetical protein